MPETNHRRTQGASEGLTASSATLGNPPRYRSLSPTHSDLLEACHELGNLLESPAWLTDSLAEQIEATGKRVEDLTVGELVTMARLKCARLNATLRQTEAVAIDPYDTVY